MRLFNRKQSKDVTLDEFLADIKLGVEDNAKVFDDPQDDFTPVVFMEHPKRQLQIIMVLEAMQDKPSFCRWLAHYGREQGATKIGFVSSTWQAVGSLERSDASKEEIKRRIEVANSWIEEHGSLRDFPDRREAVVILAADREKMLTAMAEIQRDDKNPPRLGDWEELEGMSGGPFADAIKGAVGAE